MGKRCTVENDPGLWPTGPASSACQVPPLPGIPLPRRKLRASTTSLLPPKQLACLQAPCGTRETFGNEETKAARRSLQWAPLSREAHQEGLSASIDSILRVRAASTSVLGRQPPGALTASTRIPVNPTPLFPKFLSCKGPGTRDSDVLWPTLNNANPQTIPPVSYYFGHQRYPRLASRVHHPHPAHHSVASSTL